jgi:flagellin-like protein
MFDDTDRGQVGIGTLIVFIALVLVAAIAAGVLINTADLLQSQAQETGEESTDQVSNNVNIESVTGLDATGSGDTATVGSSADGDIDKLEFVVALGSGSDPIDMSQVELQVLTDAQSSILKFGNGISATSNTDLFTVEDLQGNSVSSLGSGERVKIVIDTHADPGAGDISQFTAGDSAQITLTTADGTQTVEQIQVPDILNPPEDL